MSTPAAATAETLDARGNLLRLPAEIRASHRIVLWNSEIRDGKPTKVPYQPGRPTTKAAVDDPSTWGAFDQAVAVVEAGKADGIGIVLGTGLTGVDLDKCRNPETGAVEEWALDIVEALDSYTEVSPSGTGLHILLSGPLPEGRRRKGSVEMYSAERYFTLTGDHFPGTPQTIEKRAPHLAALHARIFPAREPESERREAQPVELDDQALIERACSASNGAKFSKLWNGDASDYDSRSEADLALCNSLAFWTGRDAGRMDSLFRLSGLRRDKWDAPRGETTYGAETIQRAIAGCRDVYGDRESRSNGRKEGDFSHFSDFSRGAGSEEKKEDAPPWVEQPRPLTREVAAPNEFPVDALGETLGNAARAIHEQVQAPLAICCQSVLATSTLAAQPHANIVLPTRQVKPLSGFYVSVAATGERKTTVDTLSNVPVREREAAMRETYAAELLAYENEREAWDAQRRQVLSPKAKHSTVGAKRVALDALGPPPDPPLIPMLTADEPTFEGLAKLLAIGQPSVGVFSGEGGLFIGGHAMNQDNQLKTAAGLSGVWDSEPIRRVRAGDGSVVLPGRRVALHLMAQPDVAAAMLSNEVLADQGLLSRILVTAPAPMAGSRAWREPSAGGDAAIEAYHWCLRALLNRPYPLAERKRNELAPRRLPLSPEATRLWVQYVGANEQRLAPGGELETVRGLGNKLPEHAARIAAVLTLVDDPDATDVPEEKLEAGIAIADHYAAEALRLHATGQTNPDLKLATRLLAWLRTTWTEKVVSLPDIYQRGLNAIGDARTARRMVQILEEHNWLRKLDKPAEVNGVKRNEVWFIVRGEDSQ